MRRWASLSASLAVSSMIVGCLGDPVYLDVGPSGGGEAGAGGVSCKGDEPSHSTEETAIELPGTSCIDTGLPQVFGVVRPGDSDWYKAPFTPQGPICAPISGPVAQGAVNVTVYAEPALDLSVAIACEGGGTVECPGGIESALGDHDGCSSAGAAAMSAAGATALLTLFTCAGDVTVLMRIATSGADCVPYRLYRQ